jgi:uncharacterized membrane protein
MDKYWLRLAAWLVLAGVVCAITSFVLGLWLCVIAILVCLYLSLYPQHLRRR